MTAQRRPVAGAARARVPAFPPGWRLLLVATGGLAASAVLRLVQYPELPGHPSPADLPLAAVAPAATIALLTLGAGHAPDRRADSLLESLLAPVTVAYAVWALWLEPSGRGGGHGWEVAGTAVLLPAADLTLALLSVTLVRQRHERGSPAVAWLLLAGPVALLVSHLGAAATALGGWPALPPLHLAMAIAAPLAWVAATAHPAARIHPEPVEGRPTPLTRMRVVLVMVAVFAGPMVLFVRVGTGVADRPVALTVGAVVVAALAVTYLVRLVEQRARVEYLALHDDLSGLPNRVYLGDRIDAALSMAQRRGERVGLLFLDLDRFKTINDSLGHAAGNEVLRLTARRLQRCVRSSDTVARLGGDEFAVLVAGAVGPAAVVAVAEKILVAFAQPLNVANRELFITPSVGIALFPDDGTDAATLLRNADAAMYRAKEHGRNTFELYTAELNARAHQRLTLESSLHTAIERDELVLHYQPKVDLRSGRIVGMEALVRWEHRDLGLVAPGEFIPLAEETGLIVPLGEWAMERACAQTREWLEGGFPPLTVAVNLSARQFQHQRVEDMVARVLRSTRLDPAALELELTESLALQDPELVTATLADLKEMGVLCSIDDFGTGYSGLSYLTRFPIDRLKIDRFFVSEISRGGDNARIVAAVIALAHGLRLQVIAEGVETDDQLSFLLEHGCDEMQGYLFSRPVPADEFEQLLMLETVAAGEGRLPRLRPGLRAVPDRHQARQAKRA